MCALIAGWSWSWQQRRGGVAHLAWRSTSLTKSGLPVARMLSTKQPSKKSAGQQAWVVRVHNRQLLATWADVSASGKGGLSPAATAGLAGRPSSTAGMAVPAMVLGDQGRLGRENPRTPMICRQAGGRAGGRAGGQAGRQAEQGGQGRKNRRLRPEPGAGGRAGGQARCVYNCSKTAATAAELAQAAGAAHRHTRTEPRSPSRSAR